MKNPLIYSEAFNLRWEDDRALRFLGRMIWALCSTLPVMGLASLAGLFGTVFGWITLIALAALVLVVLPNAGRWHPLGKIDYHIDKTYSYSTSPGKSLKAARKYWELPRSDRSLFHSNILGLLANPDLTDVQRYNLVESMDKTFLEIKYRDAERAVVKSKDVDISSVLEYMEDQRRGVAIETSTYKEFNETGSLPELSGRSAR